MFHKPMVFLFYFLFSIYISVSFDTLINYLEVLGCIVRGSHDVTEMPPEDKSIIPPKEETINKNPYDTYYFTKCMIVIGLSILLPFIFEKIIADEDAAQDAARRAARALRRYLRRHRAPEDPDPDNV